MAEAPGIVDVRNVDLVVDTTGVMALITVTDGAAGKVQLRIPVETLPELTAALDQQLVNALGERALGSVSPVSPDRSRPQPALPLHAVMTFALVGYEAGGRVVDLRTVGGEVFRFGFMPDTAAQLSEALAPGEDETPANVVKN